MNKRILLIILAFLALAAIALIVVILLLGPQRAEISSSFIELPAPEAGFILISPAFTDGDPIPAEYTCDGEDISPPLAWGEPPEGTQSYVLIVDDPDAPLGMWTHWIVYRIPGVVRSLSPDLRTNTQIDDILLYFGKNSWGKQDYGGPCPPSGEHRYIFQLYALDIMPDLPVKAKKTDLLAVMDGHVLGYAKLIGTYEK